jgi:DNA (cytosine-5)-methyltransferase 1
MRVLDLFSGIGGFSLGLERAGMKTVAFCEIEPYCRAVLKKHWPDVPIYDDVRTLTAARLAADGILETDVVGDTAGSRSSSRAFSGIRGSQKGAGPRDAQPQRRGIDLICGGFPCQDISVAGKGAGIAGERSGLWSEYARIIGEVRPRYVIVENVAALLGRGLSRVLGDMAALGYDVEWHCIPASAVGAPHRRDRLWIVAHDAGEPHGRHNARTSERQVPQSRNGVGTGDLALAECSGREGRQSQRLRSSSIVPSSWWFVEPDVGRVANGIPSRVDRLRSLGNAVVPQIPEIIGKAIMMAEGQAYADRGD